MLTARAPDRILWGTDWPHSAVFEPGKMPNDGDLLDMILDYVPDEGTRHKILVENPAVLFGFDGAIHCRADYVRRRDPRKMPPATRRGAYFSF